MIAVGLPRASCEKWIDHLPSPLRVLSGSYEGLAEQMNYFSSFFVVDAGVCSCKLFTGSSYEAVLKKYERKGWARAKIERAIFDSESKVQVGLSLELRNWLADAATDAGEAYIFIHWDSDRLSYKENVTLSAEQIGDYRTTIKAEQIIHIRREVTA